MNNLKEISKLMIQATEKCLMPEINVIESSQLSCRVGSGAKTYVRRVFKNESYHYTLTYGLKMLESKQIKMKALRWKSGKEIIKQNYFNSNPTFKNIIVACILHEVAHIIQLKEGSISKNSIHNKEFYKILDSFYEKEYHIKIDEYLSQFNEYKSATFLNDDDSLNKDDLQNIKYIKIQSRTEPYFVKILKLNPKRIRCITQFGKVISVGYIHVLEKYRELSDIPYDITFKESKKNKYNKENMKGYTFFDIIENGKLKTFKIIKLNPKKVLAEPFKENGFVYRIPYSVIKNVS